MQLATDNEGARIRNQVPDIYWNRSEETFISLMSLDRTMFAPLIIAYKNIFIGAIELMVGCSDTANNVCSPSSFGDSYYLRQDNYLLFNSDPKLGKPVMAYARAYFCGHNNNFVAAFRLINKFSFREYELAVTMAAHGIATYLEAKPLQNDHHTNREGGFVIDFVTDMRLKPFLKKNPVPAIQI